MTTSAVIAVDGNLTCTFLVGTDFVVLLNTSMPTPPLAVTYGADVVAESALKVENSAAVAAINDALRDAVALTSRLVNGSGALTGSPPMQLSAHAAMTASSALAALGKSGVNAASLKLGGFAAFSEITIEKPPAGLFCDESRPPLSAGLAAATFSMEDTMGYSGGASALAFLLSAALVAYMVWRRHQGLVAKKTRKLAKVPDGQLQLQPSSPRKNTASKKKETAVHFMNPLGAASRASHY